MRLPALTALCLGLLGNSIAAQVPSKPQGPPPALRYAVVKDGALTWTYTVTILKPVQKQVEEKGPDGKTETKTVTTLEPSLETRYDQAALKDVKATRADGKPVTPEELTQALKEATLVVISHDDEPVDAFYAQFLRSSTIVIVVEKRTAPSPS
jgi:hypothetical protein